MAVSRDRGSGMPPVTRLFVFHFRRTQSGVVPTSSSVVYHKAARLGLEGWVIVVPRYQLM